MMLKPRFIPALAGVALASCLVLPQAMAQSYAQQGNPSAPGAPQYPPPYGPYASQPAYPGPEGAYPGPRPGAPYAGPRQAQPPAQALSYPFSALALSDKQKAELENIQQQTMQRMQALFEQAAPEARKLWSLMHSGTPIQVQEASRLYDDMSRIQKKLFMLRVESWNRALSVLTPEQQNQLRTLLQQRRPPAKP